MSNNHNHNASQMKPEFLSDPAPLSADEQAYLRTLLSEEDLEKCYEGHCEAAHRKLWNYFQSAAASLTLLYRERDTRRQAEDQPDSLWHPFQSAAGALTQLYRESLEGMRGGAEGVRRSGYQKCRRDLASWASLHRKRYIRRDELLSLLASGMDSANLQHAQPLTLHSEPQDQLIMEAFSVASIGVPTEALATAQLPFPCSGATRTLKRPLCVTPPPPSSADKDVHMDTPQSKKPKSES